MGKIVIAGTEAARAATPALAGVRFDSAIRSKHVIGAADQGPRPLHLWVHDLGDAMGIDVTGAPIDHLFYLLDGTIDGAVVVGSGGSLLIEHGATAAVRARGRARIAHFHRREDDPRKPARPGGEIDAVPDGSPEGWDQRTGMLYRIFHDSRAQGSDAWFHRTDFPEGHKGVPHLHTTDEIIYIVAGEMKVGTQSYPEGTALAIDANTVYSFGAGSPHLRFVNFRADHSERIGVTRGGRTPPMEEADFLRSLPPPPRADWQALRKPTDAEREGSGQPHYLDDAAR